jgi:peptide/nickel transport system substrate-binding protein
MLVISNGPFTLTRYDPPAQFAQADAFRAEGYPLSAADWQFGEPPLLALTVETPAPAQLGETVELPVAVEGPGTLSVQYALVDPSATDSEAAIVASGAAAGENGAFTIEIPAEITSLLFPSIYQLYVLASSDQLARVTEQVVDVSIGV